MLYILYALFFISCIVLIGSVLLQPGKTDAGALFTSNVSSTAFSPRGTTSVLSKFTIGAAVVFMLSALMISMPALTGSVSVLQGNTDSETVAPATEATPTAETIIQPGDTQTVTIPADSNGNTTVVTVPPTTSNSANASNGSKTVAIPIQKDPPANN